MKQTIPCCRHIKTMGAMVCELIAKMYLCIEQTPFLLTVLKQLVWWVEGLFLFFSPSNSGQQISIRFVGFFLYVAVAEENMDVIECVWTSFRIV